jgi:uncharacterized membrane protein
MHVNVHTDPEYHSYCAISEGWNCETVAAADMSVFLGLPVSLWGLMTYLAMGALVVWGLRRRLRSATWPLGVLFWANVLTSALGIFLFALSHYVIESMCIVCAGTYLVNFCLLGTAALELRRLGSGPLQGLTAELRAFSARPAPVLAFGAAALIAMVGCLVMVPPYWRVEGSSGAGGLSSGETVEGLHWIGARKPAVEIVEFSDYQCPHCQRGHDQMRVLVEQHPERVRLVHRHYPLDHHCNPTIGKPFHPQACEYARLAHCAGLLDKFWEANDYLFAQGRRREPVTGEELAGVLGIGPEDLAACARGDEARRAVEADLAAGRQHHVRGTPTFVVEGKAYPGRIPGPVLRKLLGTKTPSGS